MKQQYVCCNIYECNEAANLHLAQPIKYSQCGACCLPDKVLALEARNLVEACPICSKIMGLSYSDDLLNKCLHSTVLYCPYCNCTYSKEEDKEAGKKEDHHNITAMDNWKAAHLLKIFMGKRSIKQMQQELHDMIWYRHETEQDPLGCEGVCQLICKTLERMEDNVKKRNIKHKILKTIDSMLLLRNNCNCGCLTINLR